MPNCKWTTDPDTGDLVLAVNGKERGRIPNPDQIRMDHDRPGGPAIGLDEIKKEFERALGCSTN